MKKILPLVGLATALLAVACGPTRVVVQTEAPQPPPPPPPAPAPAPEITYQTFYDALSPYGQWMDYPGTGYVWIPNAGPDFKPYSTSGQWVYSDEGWTWASDYPWGWAPFHYGRWFFDDNYGWCWVPGYQWAPAWVSWRTSPDYYGWAPLGPTVGVSVTIAAYSPPPRVWCFVPRQYVASPHINTYSVNETRNVTIINNTTVINNYTTVNNNYTTVNNRVTNNNVTVNNNTVVNNRNVYVVGPPRAEVEAVTHTTIRPVSFRESNTPGSAQLSGGVLNVYRPPVRTPPTTSGAQGAPAPARVTPFRPGGNTGAGGQPNGSPNNGVGQPRGGGQPASNAGQPAPNQGAPPRTLTPAPQTPVPQTRTPQASAPQTQTPPAQTSPTQTPRPPQVRTPQTQPGSTPTQTPRPPQTKPRTPQPQQTAPGKGDSLGRYKPGGSNNRRQVVDSSSRRAHGN